MNFYLKKAMHTATHNTGNHFYQLSLRLDTSAPNGDIPITALTTECTNPNIDPKLVTQQVLAALEKFENTYITEIEFATDSYDLGNVFTLLAHAIIERKHNNLPFQQLQTL